MITYIYVYIYLRCDEINDLEYILLFKYNI